MPFSELVRQSGLSCLRVCMSVYEGCRWLVAVRSLCFLPQAERRRSNDDRATHSLLPPQHCSSILDKLIPCPTEPTVGSATAGWGAWVPAARIL